MPQRGAGTREDSTGSGGIVGPSPAAVLHLLDGMRAVGIDVDALCVDAGLDPEALAARVNHLHLGEVAPLWNLAAERFGRPTVGLHVGAAMPPGNIVDYLALASPTLRASLTQIARYYGLIGRHAQWVLRTLPDDKLTLLEHLAEFGSGNVAAYMRELSVAILAVRMRNWGASPPLAVWLPHAPLGPLEEYRRVLQCDVRFESPRSGVVIDDAILDAPREGSDPRLANLLQAHADTLLARVPAEATFAQQVRGAVVAELREGEPDIAKVARRLATSARSLQRRLQEEGSSFRGMVDATRHELADVYLGEKHLSIADIAYLLGYSEPPAFIRAYKRWTGRTPSSADRRRRLAG
ncbi:MAG: AraC family transcriptional regulator ligand-binding domain-containing protein [Polyangiaceae bacterium]